MHINFLAVLVAALSTLVVGFIWYSSMFFGKVWMKETGLTEEKCKKNNMAITMLLTFIFSFSIAFIMQFIVIHQFGVIATVGGDVSKLAATSSFHAFWEEYGQAHRSFKHGVLHGILSSILFVFPLLAINGMFEQKSWKLTFINAGYWLVSFAIMGGIVSAWQ